MVGAAVANLWRWSVKEATESIYRFLPLAFRLSTKQER